MTNEAQSYSTLKLNVFLPRDRVDRIENIVVPGMPDVNCCCGGREAWIEIKTPAIDPKRPGTPLLGSNHQLSQEQMNWMLRHTRALGRSFVYIDAPRRRYLIEGAHADSINVATHTELMLMAVWSCPVPTPTERWQDFREKLMQ